MDHFRGECEASVRAWRNARMHVSACMGTRKITTVRILRKGHRGKGRAEFARLISGESRANSADPVDD